MKDCIYIGASPAAEDCAQVGQDDFTQRNIRECKAFINQLERELGAPPEGAYFGIKREEGHDFGCYREVVCYYDTDINEAYDYAYRADGSCSEWDAEAKVELGLV